MDAETAKRTLVEATLEPTDLFLPTEAAHEKRRQVIARIEEQVRQTAFDPETEPGRKEGRSLAYRIARSKTLLDDAGKALTEEQRREIKRVDAVRRELRETLEALKSEVMAPILVVEHREEQRVANHKAAYAKAERAAMLPAGAGVADIDAALSDLEDLRSREWEEWAGEPMRVINPAVEALTAARADAVAREAERAELEALRREKEERERADREREKAEAERRAAEEAATRKAEEAERRRRDEEAARIEREKAEAARRERENAEEAEKARARAAAEQDAEDAIATFLAADAGLGEEKGREIAKMIMSGDVPFVEVKCV